MFCWGSTTQFIICLINSYTYYNDFFIIYKHGDRYIWHGNLKRSQRRLSLIIPLSKLLECRSSIHAPSIDTLKASCHWVLKKIQPVCPKYRCSRKALSLVTQNCPKYQYSQRVLSLVRHDSASLSQVSMHLKSLVPG